MFSTVLVHQDDIHKFYRSLCEVNDIIYSRIPQDNELLSRYAIERQCVYEESRLGDGECDELVINDCIVVLNEISTFLQSSMDDESD